MRNTVGENVDGASIECVDGLLRKLGLAVIYERAVKAGDAFDLG